jgi:hypothetical protein
MATVRYDKATRIYFVVRVSTHATPRSWATSFTSSRASARTTHSMP